jgi:CRP-like cAMP-binding protein
VAEASTTVTPSSRPVDHSLVQALRAVPGFDALDDRTLLNIVGLSANLFYRGETVIFEKGDPADALYIVLSGNVSVCEEGGGVLATLGPGDYFGEISMLLDRTRTRGVEAAKDCELMALPKESFQELLAANPALEEHVRRKLAERLPQSGTDETGA